MKKLLLLLLIIAPVVGLAQPDIATLQNQWMESLTEGEDIQHLLFQDGYLFYKDGETIEMKSKDNYGIGQELSAYSTLQVFKHDTSRYMSLGKINYGKQSHLLLTGWRNIEESWVREIDILLASPLDLQGELTTMLRKQLTEEREEWVTLANRHNPLAHVQSSYTADAVYFGNGTRSDGHSGIAERYSYMENPDYLVDLEAGHQVQSKEDEVLEVGRYFTGEVRRGTGGLYVILWQKQAPADWKIKLDYNF